MVVVGARETLDRLIADLDLERIEITDRDRQQWLWELGGAAVLIHPESRLIGKSIREVAVERTELSAEELDAALDPFKMVG